MNDVLLGAKGPMLAIPKTPGFDDSLEGLLGPNISCIHGCDLLQRKYIKQREKAHGARSRGAQAQASRVPSQKSHTGCI